MTKPSFIKDSAIYTVSMVLSKGVSFLLLPFYTRIFSPGDYGILDLISASISIFALIFSCQIDQAVTRFYLHSKSEQSKKSYATIGFIHYIIFFGGFFALLFLFRNMVATYFINRPDLGNLIGLASFFMFTEMIYSYFRNKLKWEFKSRYYSLVICTRLLINTLLVLLLTGIFHLNLYGVYAAYVITNIVIIIHLFGLSKNSFDIRLSSFKRWKKMIFFSFPLIFSNLSISLFQFCDRFFIQHLLPAGELGIYCIAIKISTVLLLLFEGFTLAFAPYVFQNYRHPNIHHKLCCLFNILFFTSGFFVLFLTCFSPEILTVLARPPFYSAYRIIPIIMISTAIYYLGLNFSFGLGLANKNYYYIYINLVGFILNLGLDYCLVPRFGIMGAAIASLISLALVTLTSVLLSQNYFQIRYDVQRIFILVLWIAVSMYCCLTYSLFSITFVGFTMKLVMLLGYLVIFGLFFKKETILLVNQLSVLIFNLFSRFFTNSVWIFSVILKKRKS